MSTEPLTPYAEFLLREQVRGLEQMLAICRAALSATTAAAATPSPVPQTPAETAAEAATEALASAVAESVLAPAPAVPMPMPTAVPEPAPAVPMPEPMPTAIPEPEPMPAPAVPMPAEPAEPAPEPMPTEPDPAVPEPAPEPMPAWNTVRRVRPPPKVIGSPINKSQRPLYQRSDIVHGEKALATSTGKTSLTAMDIETAEQLIIHGDATEFRGFYHKRSNTLFQSPTAACVTLLKRNGVSTTWQGGAHIWLERGGKWVKLNKIINNM